MLALQSPGTAQAQTADLRAELLNALELQSTVAESIGRDDLVADLAAAIDQVMIASDEDLARIEGALDGLQTYSAALERLDATIQEEIAAAASVQSAAAASPPVAANGALPTLTPPPYFDGGILGIHCRLPDATIGIRNNTEVVLDAKIALGLAKTAWAGVEVACGLDVVALGTGGVGFFACAAAAVLVAGSEEIVEAFLRCDATVDEAHLDAAFLRAEDNFNLGLAVHGAVAAHDLNIDGDLAAHNANIDGDLVNHDTDVKALLAAIQATVNQNQQKLDEIINLLLTPQGRRDGFPLN